MNKPSLITFTTSPDYLGLSVSPYQRTLLKSWDGLELDETELAIWTQCTGRQTYPAKPFSELTVVAGARSGKDSRVVAPIVLYEAIFGDHARKRGRGERLLVPLVAQDRDAAGIAFGYISSYLQDSPVLSRLIEKPPTKGRLLLSNGLTIRCFPCTKTSLRGYAFPIGVLDELAFFRLEGSVNSDSEIQASIRRGMVGFERPRLVKISTPFAKSGILYDDFRAGWGVDDPDLLVWKAATLSMNPSANADELERQRRRDPDRFAREYLAEFAEDVGAFLLGDWIDRAIVKARGTLPPRAGVAYVAAVDPSGGGADAFTLAIGHAERSKVVVDAVQAWRNREGVTLDETVQEIAVICRRYGISRVVGDKYAGDWPVERFRFAGITYLHPLHKPGVLTYEWQDRVDSSDRYMNRSEVYLEAVQFFAGYQIEIPDDPLLIRELRMLQRSARQGGRDVIDHAPGAHDDRANVAALVAVLAGRRGIRPAATPILQSSRHMQVVGAPYRPTYGGSPRPAAGRAGQVGGIRPFGGFTRQH